MGSCAYKDGTYCVTAPDCEHICQSFWVSQLMQMEERPKPNPVLRTTARPEVSSNAFKGGWLLGSCAYKDGTYCVTLPDCEPQLRTKLICIFGWFLISVPFNVDPHSCGIGVASFFWISCLGGGNIEGAGTLERRPDAN